MTLLLSMNLDLAWGEQEAEAEEETVVRGRSAFYVIADQRRKKRRKR